MSIAIVIARLLHVGSGVFWAGAMMFNTLFLLPAMQDAGPEGAKVGAGLARRGFMTVMPLVALLAILSGFYLYWQNSLGSPDYFRSVVAMTYGVGAVAALAAFVVGITTIRPSMTRAMQLSAGAMQASGADRERMLAEAGQLRARGAKMSVVVTWFLVIAVIAMAVARYL